MNTNHQQTQDNGYLLPSRDTIPTTNICTYTLLLTTKTQTILITVLITTMTQRDYKAEEYCNPNTICRLPIYSDSLHYTNIKMQNISICTAKNESLCVQYMYQQLPEVYEFCYELCDYDPIIMGSPGYALPPIPISH